MSLEVYKAFKVGKTPGEIGIELEYEGSNLPKKGYEVFWARTADNSLRGDSGEFVLRKPVSRDNLDTALGELDKAFHMSNTKIVPTYRAGTHVHINVQELSTVQLISYFVMYFMFENLLLKICSPERTGNHFCLRLRDASSLADLLAEFIKNPSIGLFQSDNYRYAALNVNSIPKFGSLEFRALESTTDWKKLTKWVDLLLALKQASTKFDNPASVLLSASGDGFEEFGKKIFGKLWGDVRDFYSEEEVRQNIWEIQHAVFSKDWTTVNLNIFAKYNLFD